MMKIYCGITPHLLSYAFNKIRDVYYDSPKWTNAGGTRLKNNFFKMVKDSYGKKIKQMLTEHIDDMNLIVSGLDFNVTVDIVDTVDDMPTVIIECDEWLDYCNNLQWDNLKAELGNYLHTETVYQDGTKEWQKWQIDNMKNIVSTLVEKYQ